MAQTKAKLEYLSMCELSGLVRKKAISVTELVKTYLERIERLNPKLNAYITICGDEALASAKAIDERIAKGKRQKGLLLGMPIALKDQFDTKGVLSTNGSLALKDNVPQEDSTVVIKLKEAGAIILGKLNMSEFACGGTEDQPFGVARNPWNTNFSPAGSSSGSGVAVSAWLCAASVGEDTGGSGRGPANVCGLVGLRPSAGLISRYGVHPLSPSLDSASPITLTVQDCAALTQAIAGYDDQDELSSRRPVPDYLAGLKRGMKGIRIGVIKEFIEDTDLDAEVKAAVQAALIKLQELGAAVDEVSIPNVKVAGHALATIVWSEGWSLNHKWYGNKNRYPLFRQSTRLGFVAGSLLPNKIFQRARQAQAIIRAQTLKALETHDLLVCPTSPKQTPTIEDTIKVANPTTKDLVVARHMSGHTAFVALSGVPGISIPCGFSKMGMPIGFQLIGRPFDEATVLRMAHAYEQATEWHTRHPEV